MVISDLMKSRIQSRYRGGGVVEGEDDMPRTELGEEGEESGSGGIISGCAAINCDHNDDRKCMADAEISAGGACMTYSKSEKGEETPMAETPGEKESPMPEGGVEE
jgi:hypothetical protein